MIWEKDTSTIWHWFGYWLGVFLLAYTFQFYGYAMSLIIGLVGSQIFWLIKELVWDKIYRKQPFNLADALAGWLFGYVFKNMWLTQQK